MSHLSPEPNPNDPSNTPVADEATIEVVAQDKAAHALFARLQELHQKGRSGSNWFYWIAGLSLVNSVIILSDGETYFVIGLGITLLIDAIARELAHQHAEIAQLTKAAVFGFDLIVALVIVAFGWLSGRRHRVVFAIGMFLYLLDGLLFVLVQDWFSAGFHAFALFCMWGGFRAYGQLNAAEQALGGFDKQDLWGLAEQTQ